MTKKPLCKHFSQYIKKLVAIFATCILITQTSTKNTVVILASTVNNFTLPLEHVPHIYYQVYFIKNQAKIKALLDSGNKVNIITLVYKAKLGFKIQSINVEAQKINSSTSKLFKIDLANF